VNQNGFTTASIGYGFWMLLMGAVIAFIAGFGMRSPKATAPKPTASTPAAPNYPTNQPPDLLSQKMWGKRK
jgi:hypothetical protein